MSRRSRRIAEDLRRAQPRIQVQRGRVPDPSGRSRRTSGRERHPDPDRQALQRDGHLFAAAAFGQRIRPVRRGIPANQGRGVLGRSRPVVGRRGRAAQSGQNPHRTASGGLLLRHDARTPARSLRPKRAFPRLRQAGRSHADPLRTRFLNPILNEKHNIRSF